MKAKRHKSLNGALALAAVGVLLFSSLLPVQAASAADGIDFNAATPLANQLPIITVWYPNALSFGQRGLPQDQVNILGSATDPDGSVVSLTYSLNKKPAVSLSLGTSNDRLINPGDFNINLFTNQLNPGNNTLDLVAKDNSGGTQTKTVNFSFSSGIVPPLPYATNWASAANIADQAQVVDGLWTLSASGVEPALFGYDRLIAIGDLSWSNYEILVPVTVHGFYPNPLDANDAGGVGIISRWRGHFTDPSSPSEQPPTGWWRIGAYGYYSNRLGKLALRMDQTTVYTQTYPFSLNKTYLFKLRSETLPSTGTGQYSFKIWESGTPEPLWNDARFTGVVNKVDIAGDPQQGGMLLVAHRADATFGDVTVCPLSGFNYTLNVSTSGGGTVTAQNGPATGSYACGQGVTLTATASPGWTFAGWSGAIQSSSRTISFNMVKDYNLTATFTAGQTLGGTVYIPYLKR